MTITRTENAVVAQMVRDAIVNDPRMKGYTNGDLHARAKVWHERAQNLKEKNRMYFSSISDLSLSEFLCAQESSLGILDFWDGDIVDCVRNGDINNTSTGVVKEIGVNPTIKGGGHAKILFTNGETETYNRKYILHSSIPQELVDIAKTQFMATHSCPLMEKQEENKENENV